MYRLTFTSSAARSSTSAATVGGITEHLRTQLAEQLAVAGRVEWTISTPGGASYPGSIILPEPGASAGVVDEVVDEVYSMLAYDLARAADQAATAT